MEKLIKDYFSLESLGITARKLANDPEERALAILNKTVRRLPNNRYESGLLWRSDNESMPHNKAQAESRLINIEKKLDKNADMKRKLGFPEVPRPVAEDVSKGEYLRLRPDLWPTQVVIKENLETSEEKPPKSVSTLKKENYQVNPTTDDSVVSEDF